MFEEDKRNFSDLANFNLITEYTVSIFLYEYGDMMIWKLKLKKATEIEPENLIYKLVFLGSLQKFDKENTEKQH